MNQDTFFIDIPVKSPVIEIISLNLGLVILGLEYPAPFMKGTVTYQGLVARVVLLVFQVFLPNTVLPGAFSRRVPVVAE